MLRLPKKMLSKYLDGLLALERGNIARFMLYWNYFNYFSKYSTMYTSTILLVGLKGQCFHAQCRCVVMLLFSSQRIYYAVVTPSIFFSSNDFFSRTIFFTRAIWVPVVRKMEINLLFSSEKGVSFLWDPSI